MQVAENFVASILVEVESTEVFDFVVCQGKIGMEVKLVVPDIAKDFYFSKDMDWYYTMVEEKFESYMHPNFEQD